MKFRKSQILFLLVIVIWSCSSAPKEKKGLELQRQIEDYLPFDTTLNKIYIVDTKPVDSINPKQVIYDIFRIDHSKYPKQVQLYARPYDSSGNFITQMAYPYKETSHNYFPYLREKLGELYKVRDEEVNEFTVREYGIGDSIAFNIQLTLDYSGSISQLIDIIQEGTFLFVDLKYPFDRIGVNSFNDKFSQKVPIDDDGDRIKTLFAATKNEGFGRFSAVYDAAYSSLVQFENTDTTKPRILVLFSDGDDNYSKVEIGQVIELAQEMNVNIFTIAFGYSIDDNLKYMADYTGGKFYKASTREELLAIFRDIYNSLRNYYLITYKPPVYWGWHTAFTTLDIPGMDSMKVASGKYNTSDLTPWSDLTEAFKRPIQFEFDSSRVLPESYPILDEITDAMMVMPRVRLEIQGHTDNLGTIEYNQQLSEARAKAVMEALIDRGISHRRLRYRGFGMSRPIASNETEAGQALNRRTEFVITAK